MSYRQHTRFVLYVCSVLLAVDKSVPQTIDITATDTTRTNASIIQPLQR